MKKRIALTLWAVLAAAAARAADVSEFVPSREIDHLFETGKGPYIPTAVTHNYDVRRYTIAMSIDDAAKTVAATTTVRLASGQAGLTQVAFDFYSGLTVTQVSRAGTPLSFVHQGNVLTITLDRPMAMGEVFELAVAYNGTPGEGMYFSSSGVYTSTEESYSRNWFPCYDEPSDKADEGCELDITVRDDWYVAGNGLLVSRASPARGRAAYRWRETYPIATYLIAITASDYYLGFNQDWHGMPIKYYIYANQAGDAPIYFEHQPDMLDCYSGKFVTYPFVLEKYGVAAVKGFVWGGMENQTITHIGSSSIGPNHNGDSLLAHELAHSWWGDRVTCGTWMDLWLNEGQATYCDALYTEYAQGIVAFRLKMQSYAVYYFNEDAQHRFPIYNPEDPWSATVYEKGAWVMHMLRRLLGDANFYAAWNNYGNHHAYGTALTTDLQHEFEVVYGSDLTWYFDQWVYKAGYPEFKYSWSTTNNGHDVHVVINQTQKVDTETPLFRCLVDLTFEGASGNEYKKAVWVSGIHHTFDFTFPEKITDMYFDRDGWLLHKHTDGTPVALDYFRAQPADGAVAVTWAASAEINHAGFNVYREGGDGPAAAPRARLNAKLITGRSPYRFIDAQVTAGAKYRYWLEAVDLNGGVETYGPAPVRLPVKPAAFALAQNVPNPARGVTTFRFTLPAAGPATLAVYDLAGRAVWRRTDSFPAGENKIAAALKLAAGVYIYRLDAGANVASRRMVVAQ